MRTDMTSLRVLIVGGYGTFGGRLVELLEDEQRLTLLVAGRSLQRATAYCAGRPRAGAKLSAIALDRASATAQQLLALKPDLVVDASGPFQTYGASAYRLIELCIECKINYLDLADGSAFVEAVSRFDAVAREAGVFVLAGVSSFPVLTAAVVRRLSRAMSQVVAIRAGIAPSPFAGVGSNVIRAIASYAGQPTAIRRNGSSEEGRPFVETMPFVIAVPGRMPLKLRQFSLVDVPDLRVLPALWPTVQDVWIGAAPVPSILHRTLTLFARLVRLRVLPSLSWLAGAMHFVTERAQWGEDRGGMFVLVAGRSADGAEAVRVWNLLAEGKDGPLIPCMAVEAVIRKWLSGNAPDAGARTALADVDLSDYEALFQRRTIYTGIRDLQPVRETCLYRRILGESWRELAPAIQQLHERDATDRFEGRCNVRRGRNPVARLIARVIGFPRAGSDQRVTVQFFARGFSERWVRACNGRSFASVQQPGRGRSEWLIAESFGPVTVCMALLVERANLRYVLRGWKLFGIPLPLAWGPRSTASESTADGLFRFDVEISHPLTGLIVHYVGTLAPLPVSPGM